MVRINAIILKGENEPYFDYAVKSIKDTVDEVVIVSAPFAKDIDFAKMRNEVFENQYWNPDWVLVLDADEILANFDGSLVTRKQLEDLITNAEANGLSGYHIFTLHFMYNYRFIDGRNNGSHFSYARFFKKSDFVGYKYKVHEIPEFKNGQNLVTTSNFAIFHFGHCKGMEFLREKYMKRMKIKDNPFKVAFGNQTVDQYCSTHEIFRMSIPLINYNGPLPSVMKLW